MKVLKFGGSSVATPERIKDVARIILEQAKLESVVVVVSALQGVTNQLLECAHLAAAGKMEYENLEAQLMRRHRDNLKALGVKHTRAERPQVDRLLGNLHDALHGISLLRDCPPRALDLVASFGEQLSALILTSYLRRKHPAKYVDAREFIITDEQFTNAAVIFEQTNKAIRKYFKQFKSRATRTPIPVITGFIGATEDGRTTTIGRNGSDYTAAIIGAGIGASMVEIWTDVDGVYSADPRAVHAAFVLKHLSYEEAMELSYFGAKVLHSATIAPAVAKNIPILIKNTLNPSAPGTLIARRVDKWQGVAKGISSVDEITLFTLRGMAMVGIPGTAERLFRTLGSNRVNVILISQASSEHTICFAVSTVDRARARKAIHQEFHYELQGGLTTLDEKSEQSIVAIVGEGMKGTPGVAGKVFESLGRNTININAIAQGASERNISFVIDSVQKSRALNVIHQAFFERRKRLSLIVVGVGNIGSALLRQLHQQQPFLLAEGYDVQVCGVADSKRFVLRPDGIDLSRWKDELVRSPHGMDVENFAESIAHVEFTNAALVDCTASAEMVDAYMQFVNANMHIITPNKKANVLPWKNYQALMELLRLRQKHFLYEANVGAGLPIISTLQDLIASGDSIVRIEGIFSGTLSYLFNNYDGQRPFSILVQEAHARGFTEPDPREDLSGADVARKLLILARQLGWKMELGDIRVSNLVPGLLGRGVFSKKFFAKFSKFDSAMQRKFNAARSHGSVLRYVGTLEKGTALAGLKEVPRDHPLASAKGADNIIAFTTHRYSQTPLVVQGPGAGADVTAMGVFSDILKLLHYLPF